MGKTGAGDKLDGNDWSWLDYDYHVKGEDFSFKYITNKGTVTISQSGQLIDACYGFGAGYGKNRLWCLIYGSKYRIATEHVPGSDMDERYNDKELSRAHGKSLQLLPLQTVLDALEEDRNTSVAGMTVKKHLMKCVMVSEKLDRSQWQQVIRTIKHWRKPICMVKRQPIVTTDGQ